jgi:hypothetical protein
LRGTIRRIVALAALPVAFGCRGDVANHAIELPKGSLAEVTADEWQRLAGRRLFFAHQSVGANMLDGVQAVLKANPSIPLRVVEVADASAIQGTGLFHKRVGTNGKPSTKLAEFSEMTTAAFAGADAAGIAMLKFCYADVKGHTDPVALFEEYRRGVDALRAARPGVTIVHVTMPLWVDTGLIDHWGTIVLGKATPIRTLNAARHRFNELLREGYRGREPFFDLAALESVAPNGSVADARYDGGRVPSLAREWTTDGGHLNDAARRRIAELFLVTLAKLPSGPERVVSRAQPPSA